NGGNEGSGGGGGGYWGGGGATATAGSQGIAGAAGGGGSSWLDQTRFVPGTTLPSTPAPGGGDNVGNGKVIITFIQE
ncbi:MAG: hypothetical protein LBV52_01700, partial [Spirochaetaceae bacterium]|nr:hypothetical protein [Spirochaetaceae bacterium]